MHRRLSERGSVLRQVEAGWGVSKFLWPSVGKRAEQSPGHILLRKTRASIAYALADAPSATLEAA
jgi:hypothetical protein